MPRGDEVGVRGKVLAFELPQYPNAKPTKGSALCVNAEVGWMGRNSTTLFVAGCGVDQVSPVAKPETVRARLIAEATRYLTYRAQEARARAEHAEALLRRWTENPDQFAVALAEAPDAR